MNPVGQSALRPAFGPSPFITGDYKANQGRLSSLSAGRAALPDAMVSCPERQLRP
jgi:hypothetical protein